LRCLSPSPSRSSQRRHGGRWSISSYPVVFSVSFEEIFFIFVSADASTPHRFLSPTVDILSRIRRRFSALLCQFDWKFR
jgi:hypothetical protein